MHIPDDISAIARIVQSDWKNVNYGAKPYLRAMLELQTINDKYGDDRGAMIVAYFLGNARSWHGEVAKAVKAKLNALIKTTSA